MLAGFSDVTFVPEPVAGRLVVSGNDYAAQTALVFDFGGGTLDFTILRANGRRKP